MRDKEQNVVEEMTMFHVASPTMKFTMELLFSF